MSAAALPAWARELEDRLAASPARVFVLHYNVGDVVPVGDEYIPLRDFLGWWMGYLACRAVDDTQREDQWLSLTPVITPEMTGVAVVYRR